MRYNLSSLLIISVYMVLEVRASFMMMMMMSISLFGHKAVGGLFMQARRIHVNRTHPSLRLLSIHFVRSSGLTS
jgi:hypothetical protein